MKAKDYDKLAKGTKVKKTFNGVTTFGTVTKVWEPTKRGPVLESRFLPDGSKRPLDVHVALIELA